MNQLKKYFEQNNQRLIHKWDHYFDIYDRYFNQYRNKPVNIFEIGVFQGGSLQMWKNYFGTQAQIFGLDINPKCKEFEEDQIEIFIGSQADRTFLNNLFNKLPPIDIIIDDGSHIMQHQIISFQELYPKLKEGGIYLCEDLHTSYDYRYGGGHKRNGTFIEFSKKLIDNLNAFHSQQFSLKVNKFTTTTNALHFHDGMLVIEKKNREQPVSLSSHDGKITLNPDFSSSKASNSLKRKLYKKIQKLLQILRIRSWWIK